MAKGSQLTQLKSALSSAGITGPKPSSKKRKRTSAVPLEKDKEKKAARLEEIHRRLNPFDVKVTKLKHDVGGRKIKGVVGRPAQSKQTGIEQVWFSFLFQCGLWLTLFFVAEKDAVERVSGKGSGWGDRGSSVW